MSFKSLFALILSAACLSLGVNAKENDEWFLHSAISPNGKQIAFSYKGDIYLVPSKGGTARPLTIHSAWEGHPVWSKDGKQLAFASDRTGNLDVFVMPSLGGSATRLTHHSAGDIPQAFINDDSEIIFSSPRMDTAESSIHPTSRMPETYAVNLQGGTPRMLTTIAMSELDVSPNGKQVVYRNEKAYENPFRKHDVSSFARDVFVMELASNKHTQLTDFAGGDHSPVFSDNNTIFYTSEQETGVFNVWKMDLDGTKKQQVTDFKQHPVRSLSISDKGTLAYVHHGSIYVQKGKKSQHLDITIQNDNQENDIVNVSVGRQISEFSVSPDGKEIAFIARGEVFVTSKEFKTTVRITNTPGMERGVSFHKDGRTLLYTAQRDGRWGLYETSLQNEDEPYFFAATTFEEQALLVTDTDSFQPVYSPDGEKVAFLSSRDEIRVIDRATKKVNVALDKQYNYSYADGDIQFSWSGDSQWLTADFATNGRLFVTNIGVFPADGSTKPIDISLSGYADAAPVWSKKDDVVLWSSTRYGQRDHGSWGREADVVAAFLTQDAFDKFSLDKEEYALKQELEKKAKKAKKAKKDKASKEEKSDNEAEKDESSTDTENKPSLDIEWAELDDRTVRLTMHSSDLGEFFLTEDASSLYYLSRFEKGFDLWQHNIREKSTKLVAKLNARRASIQQSPDGKHIYVLADGTLKSSKLGGKIALKTIGTSPSMSLNAAKERDYIFEYGWQKINDKFYREDFHGIDWDFMRESYGRKLPSIGHNRDLANLFAEMTGELNASHIGSSYRPRPSPQDDNTGQLGLLFDFADTANGLVVTEVLNKGPFGKASSQVEVGVKLTHIDGVALDTKTNLFEHLNRTVGKRTRLSFIKSDGDAFEEVMKPISRGQQSALLYQRWVDSREAYVEKISNGRLGYVHIPAMNDRAFRNVYSNLLGKHFNKEAVVVDTRWNGGGWLHNDLAKLFSGKEYFTMHVRGREYHGDPMDQWTKPSVLVVNEGNYSDGHAIAYTYEELGLGDIVGMPVPGTMTAVWWSTSISGDIRIGVPQVGVKSPKGEYLENNQVEPTYKINNTPNDLIDGEDKQLDKAVEVLFNTLSQQ
jgi:Tol biopolymer transport system component/C-terminal processing protease CtpA/Prc